MATNRDAIELPVTATNKLAADELARLAQVGLARESRSMLAPASGP
jgi:hypothetical protein